MAAHGARPHGQELTLTHEFLANLLGVRRPGVSAVPNVLEERGFIQRSRGVITIIDRKGLEKFSNGAYGVPEAEFKRLFN